MLGLLITFEYYHDPVQNMSKKLTLYIFKMKIRETLFYHFSIRFLFPYHKQFVYRSQIDTNFSKDNAMCHIICRFLFVHISQITMYFTILSFLILSSQYSHPDSPNIWFYRCLEKITKDSLKYVKMSHFPMKIAVAFKLDISFFRSI